MKSNYNYDNYEYFDEKAIKDEVNTDQYYSGLLTKDSFHLNPLKLTYGLANQCLSKNIKIFENSGESEKIFTQKLFDIFMTEVESSYREMGISDQSFGKKMKIVIESFYGRTKMYDQSFNNEEKFALGPKLSASRFLQDFGCFHDQTITRRNLLLGKDLQNVYEKFLQAEKE